MRRRQTTQTTRQQGERRSVVRYRTEVPVIFHWSPNGDEYWHGEGLTRDISVAGAHIFSDVCPPLNALVNVEILLPQSPEVIKPRMSAKMRVVRVDKEARQQKLGFSGFSVTGRNFVLLDGSKPRLSYVTARSTRTPGSSEGFFLF
jgi:hypothetical protein